MGRWRPAGGSLGALGQARGGANESLAALAQQPPLQGHPPPPGVLGDQAVGAEAPPVCLSVLVPLRGNTPPSLPPRSSLFLSPCLPLPSLSLLRWPLSWALPCLLYLPISASLRLSPLLSAPFCLPACPFILTLVCTHLHTYTHVYMGTHFCGHTHRAVQPSLCWADLCPTSLGSQVASATEPPQTSSGLRLRLCVSQAWEALPAWPWGFCVVGRKEEGSLGFSQRTEDTALGLVKGGGGECLCEISVYPLSLSSTMTAGAHSRPAVPLWLSFWGDR